MVFAGEVFSQQPIAQAQLGLCDQPQGQRAPQRGQVVSLGMEMVCDAVLTGGQHGQQEKLCNLAWDRVVILRSSLLVI